MCTRLQRSVRRESGAALIVALLIMLMMTVIGLTAMSTSTLEEKMAGNMRDQQLAFQAAETALLDGEGWLEPLIYEPDTCTSAPCTTVWEVETLSDLSSQTISWWESNGVEYGVAGSQDIPDVAQDPHYVIEYQSFVPDSLRVGHGAPTGKVYYRTTTQAVGGTTTAEAVIEGSYLKRFN